MSATTRGEVVMSEAVTGRAGAGPVVSVYAYEKVPLDIPSVFFAGPTPRDPKVPSWRPVGVEALTAVWDQPGPVAVLIPEPRDGRWATDYTDQYEWEHEAMEAATVIGFWVPRDMVSMPALTTNIEWGFYCRSGKVVLGCPPDAPDARKNRYMLHQAKRYAVPVSETLRGWALDAKVLVSGRSVGAGV